MTPSANKQAAMHNAGNVLQKSFSTPAERQSKMGKDDFMKLMMAQATHQDPMNPMDSAGMMQQLTSMGSMEQLININESLANMQKVQGDVMRANTFAFLDKDVTVRGGNLPVKGGAAPGMRFELPREAHDVTIAITNEQGVPVRTLELGGFANGAHQAIWDGKGDDGMVVNDGQYKYQVMARDANGESVPASLYAQGKVSGVQFENGRPRLKINGEDVDIADIVEMSNRSERLFSNQVPAQLMRDMKGAAPIGSDRRR